MERKIYLLMAKQSVDYDSYSGHVVIANTEDEARKICPYANEGNIWVDKKGSTCVELGKTNNKAGLILSSFHAG